MLSLLFFCALPGASLAGPQAAKSDAGAAAPPAPSGQALYEQHCAVCHFSGSTAKKIGPGLQGLYVRGKFADGRRVDDAGVTKWIVAGGADMPGYKDSLRPAEVRTLVLYVKSL